VTSAQREIETLRVRVSEHGVAAANTAARALEGDRQYIALSAEAALPRARQTLDEAYGSLRGSADRVLQAARKSLTSDMEQIVGLGPGHTLARGFAIVRDGDQRVVTRSGGAGNDLTIEFADGRVPVRRAKIGD
jgi:exodeoxyribonuclease VII large subunit